MQNHKVKIREAKMRDNSSIYEWLNDKYTKSMSFSNTTPSFTDHSEWFKKALNSKDHKIYIGEIQKQKIGICRFQLSNSGKSSEVSINMNPSFRAKGLGRILLIQSIDKYFQSNEVNLIAKIKINNRASIKIFIAAGFEKIKKNKKFFNLKKKFNKIKIKKVEVSDADLLYELLSKRSYSISHKVLPTKIEHIKFINSKPYRFWAIIFDNDNLIGSFYIQNDNSIGVNLRKVNKEIVQYLLQFISINIKPREAIKSKIPDYFFINVPYDNIKLKKILSDLKFKPIQVSYKIK